MSNPINFRKLGLPDDFSNYVFLVGSGISVPSGLPSGWEFNSVITKIICSSSEEVQELLPLVNTSYKSKNASLRFEQLMYLLRERIDHNLDILDCFGIGSPTGLHDFFAEVLKRNGNVFTTNFDSLIEDAYKIQENETNHSTLIQVYLEDESDEIDDHSCVSFERYCKKSFPRPAILKLHGTLKDTNNLIPTNSNHRSVSATLDHIGTRSGENWLEPFKYETLKEILRNKVLCVIGYSGSDDFDIIPSLNNLFTVTSGLIWIRHDTVDSKIIKLKRNRHTKLLPDKINQSKLPLESYIASGNTEDIIRIKFGFSSSLCKSPESPGFETVLYSLKLYKELKTIQKKIILGRIAEESTNPLIARAKYQEVLKMGRRVNSTELAYAFFRLGHLNRIEGDDVNSLICLKKSLNIFRKLEESENVALVLNALGNRLLVRGMLNQAYIKYNEALDISKDLYNYRLKASVLNNIGIIWKKRGDYKQAIEYYDKALEIDSAIRDRTGMMREMGNKINVLILTKKYHEVISSCDEIAKTQELLGKFDLLAVTLNSRGLALLHLGYTEEAFKEAKKVYKLEKKLQRKEGIARYLSLLGGIYASKKEWNKAIFMYKKSVLLQNQIGRPEGASYDNKSLGECYIKTGQFEKAIECFTESYKHFTKLGNNYEAKNIRLKIERLNKILLPG